MHAIPVSATSPSLTSGDVVPGGGTSAQHRAVTEPAAVSVATAQPTAATRLRTVLSVVGRGLALALLVGTIGGLAARLWMRLFSVVLGHETGFSWQGTLGIVMVFTLGVIPGALAVAGTTRRWRRVPLGLGVLFLWYGTVVTAVQEDLPSGVSVGETIGLALVALAFLLTPIAQIWGLTRLADRRRRAT